MAGEKVTVTIRDGGPFGFRLFGGHDLDLPLTIARLRRKSKAQEAGLHEGDCLLTINGYSCKDMSHATAMTLVDTSGQQLAMTVLRGTQDKHAVDAAFQTLGPSKVVPPHLLQGQTRTKTHIVNNHAGAGDAMDVNDASGASGAVQLNGPSRTQQTFHDGDSTRQVTTETSQQKFGSTTVTKVRREELMTSGGGRVGESHTQLVYGKNTTSSSYPPVGGAASNSVPSFSVTRFDSSSQPQQKPGTWAPPGGAGGNLTVSAPEGVHVQQNADHSVSMTVGLGSPRQQGLASPGRQGMASPGRQGMASPRQRDPSPSHPPQYDQGRHVPQFNVSKVGGGASKPGLWTPGGAGDGGAPVLQLFTVEPPKWSPSTNRKPAPPEVAPKPQFLPQQGPPRPSYDQPDAVPDGRPPWSHLDPSARDSPITRIPQNPPQIEPLHFSELIRGESFSDEDDYLDSPNSALRKSFFNKKIYADSSFYDDPEAKYPTIEEQIKMARKVAMSLIHPANKKARGHKMFMKRLNKSSRWVAGVGGQPEQVEVYVEYEDGEPEEEEKYYAPNPWKSTGHTWQPPTGPAPAMHHTSPSFRPTSAPSPQLLPYQAGGVAPMSAVPKVPMPEPYHLQKTEPKPEFQLMKNPAYRPSIPKPFRLATDDQVTEAPQPLSFGGYEEPDAAGARDSPAFKPASEFNKEFNEDMEIPMAPPPPPPPIPTLSNWATPGPTKSYLDDKENMKAKLTKGEFEKVRLFGKKTMHNMVSPQVCFSLADDLRNMKGKGGKLFAKRRARAEQWVIEDKSGPLTGPNNEIRAKILGHAQLNSPQSPPVKPAMDNIDYNSRPVGGPNRLKQLIDGNNKSGVSPWEAAIDGNVDAAFDHLRYNTLPLRGRNGGGSHSQSLIDLTGQFTSSNPAAADAAPSYVTATTYHKGRPQKTQGARPSQAAPRQSDIKLPEYTRKIQPWGAVPAAPTSSGPPSSSGGLIDWSESGEPYVTSQPGIQASSGPSNPDYNRRMKPWRGSGNFDHVDVGRMSEAPAPSPGGGGPVFRPVSFKAPSSNFGAFTGAPTSSHVQNHVAPAPAPAPAPMPVGGDNEGYSDL